VTRVIVYCGFLQDENIKLPATGVGGSPVNVLGRDQLSLLWSEVAWPFEPAGLQQKAVEFHQAVQHVFQQAAVVPFRLLSIFDDVSALAKFAAENAVAFTADLERLREYVQMESVVYVIQQRAAGEEKSGRAYLERKADVFRLSIDHAASVKAAVQKISHGIQVREVKSGTRIFALVRRGDHGRFRGIVNALPLPDSVSRRVSGPWPAAEFLSSAVKMPQSAGQR
jgi:Gas vesicle synthesis protein GvpL/GvpF